MGWVEGNSRAERERERAEVFCFPPSAHPSPPRPPVPVRTPAPPGSAHPLPRGSSAGPHAKGHNRPNVSASRKGLSRCSFSQPMRSDPEVGVDQYHPFDLRLQEDFSLFFVHFFTDPDERFVDPFFIGVSPQPPRWRWSWERQAGAQDARQLRKPRKRILKAAQKKFWTTRGKESLAQKNFEKKNSTSAFFSIRKITILKKKNSMSRLFFSIGKITMPTF